jgi:Domain of unknown function (DUF4260)
MKTLLIFEETAQFLLATYFFYQFGYGWWVFPAVLLLPDLSIVGYLISPYWGAISYNFFHHKAVAIIIIFIGYLNSNITIQAVGLILFAHSAMDRVFGYGLKYPDNFKNTHLGMIGK